MVQQAIEKKVGSVLHKKGTNMHTFRQTINRKDRMRLAQHIDADYWQNDLLIKK